MAHQHTAYDIQFINVDVKSNAPARRNLLALAFEWWDNRNAPHIQAEIEEKIAEYGKVIWYDAARDTVFTGRPGDKPS